MPKARYTDHLTTPTLASRIPPQPPARGLYAYFPGTGPANAHCKSCRYYRKTYAHPQSGVLEKARTGWCDLAHRQSGMPLAADEYAEARNTIRSTSPACNKYESR